MGLKLVICEKPSVAMAIARALSVSGRGDGYVEGNGYVISWCVGHLVELAPPEEYGEKYAKWRKDDLPILPEKWKYKVSASTKDQFGILKKLMARADVTAVVNACDAGREGELIFRLVYGQCGCKKPIERLWVSSMEDSAIREGFANLRPGTEYDALYAAALCRERADWIVGMNGTRLFSCLYGVTLNVGRVMTPTLGMAVTREAAISDFVPEPFYTVQIKADGCSAASERFKEKSEADAVKSACEKELQTVVRKIERKEKSEKPPALYDLTSLQRDANRILGYTAQQTLDYTQSLYEKKLVTYPRTDSRYLTDDMAGLLPSLVQAVAGAFSVSAAVPVNVAQVIDGSKVSDHHAIIPTRSVSEADISNLPAGEKEVLRLISARLLSAVGEPHRYAETVIETECGGSIFTAKGKTVLQEGWRGIEKLLIKPDKEEKTENSLPEVSEGDVLSVGDVAVKEGKTTPPKHFTEDLLLQAMETASADEFPEEAERKGIGTPATRAATIEKLVQKGFLERKGGGKAKNLIPTDKGTKLIKVMPEQLVSPSMTAQWEEKLVQMEHGEYASDAFMGDISGMVTGLVKEYSPLQDAGFENPNKGTVIGKCPRCGSDVVEKQKAWFCSNRGCKFALWKDNVYFDSIGKKMTRPIAEKLLKDGRVYLKDCKSRKTGKNYNATLILSTDDSGKANFSLEFDNTKKKGGKA